MLDRWFRFLHYRKKEIQETAKELNLSYQEKDEFGLINLLKDFKLFKRGRRKRIKHILAEADETLQTDLRIFDYHYTISTGKSSRTFRQTVFFIQSKQLDLPSFYMKPEHFFHKISNYLGIDDIDFIEFPEFSDQYWLKGDESRLRKEMNPLVLHFFTIEKEWSLEGLNYYLIFYKKNQLFPKDEVIELYHKGKELFNLFAKSSINNIT